MKELIKVTTNEQGQQLVSARELHEKLLVEQGKKERFSQWFKRHLQYGFEEGVDFTSVKIFTVVNNGAKKELEDYAVTLDMAKELCMLQKSEVGKQFRQYFIECEKQLQNLKPQLTPEQELQLRVLNGDSLNRTLALREYKEFIEAPLKEEIKTLETFTDVITCTGTCISMKEFADSSFNLYKLGRNKLMGVLRKIKILTSNNIPYQRFIKEGHFEVQEVNRNNKIVTVTRITPKGQKYLCKRLNEYCNKKIDEAYGCTVKHEDPKKLQAQYLQ